MSHALLTDLYELTMAASYLRRGMVGPATFSLFVRRLPRDRGFLVAAGLDHCLSHLERFSFAGEDLEWLRANGFEDRDVDAFAGLRFTGDVWAVPEGRVVLADEPLLEVTAPLAEAQLVETYLLNQVTFQTALATKAARCRIGAGEIDLVDFSFRRTHGAEAAMAAARVSAIAGFVGTSNVEAARRYGLRATGTMAHSYVQAFPAEVDAFRAFAEDFPGRVTFLVDTYDTLRGTASAIDVMRDLALDPPLAVRLDSGDLVALARSARRMLDDAGLRHVRILVSGGLDEYDLERLRSEHAPVDGAGLGTRFGVSADAPSLDSVYKLVACGDRPVLKLSEAKATVPGAKQVWRQGGKDDLLSGRDEPGPDGFRPLLAPVMRSGRRLGPADTLPDAAARLRADLEWLPAASLTLRDPVQPRARVSEGLRQLAGDVAQRILPGPRP